MIWFYSLRISKNKIFEFSLDRQNPMGVKVMFSVQYFDVRRTCSPSVVGGAWSFIYQGLMNPVYELYIFIYLV